jgi:hypothetical protein
VRLIQWIASPKAEKGSYLPRQDPQPAEFDTSWLHIPAGRNTKHTFVHFVHTASIPSDVLSANQRPLPGQMTLNEPLEIGPIKLPMLTFDGALSLTPKLFDIQQPTDICTSFEVRWPRPQLQVACELSGFEVSISKCDGNHIDAQMSHVPPVLH